MNVNGIGNQAYYEKTNGTKTGRKSNGGGFYESLSENINDQMAAQKKGGTAVSKNMAANTGYQYRNVSRAAGAHDNEGVSTEAVTECEPRQITYQESDYVKVFAERGYTLMAQVDVNGRSVYIEQKMEDGTIKGYDVEIDKLKADSKDSIAQMALEAWNTAEKEEDSEEKELTMEEALLQFYEFIEDRIKNGPPKYQIGKDEFSIAEWNKLLEGLDDQIDAIKEEMRERIEKMKEQQIEAELSQKLQNDKEKLQDAENKKTEEELLMSLFQDKGI